MKHIGYSYIETATGVEKSFSRSLPITVIDPAKPRGRVGTFFAVGAANTAHEIVERWIVEAPSKSYARGTDSISFDGTHIIVNPNWVAPAIGALRNRMKRVVKQSARDKIEAKQPGWRLINALADGENASSPRFMQVKTVRDHSNVLEAEIDALTTITTLDAWQEHDWPVI